MKLTINTDVLCKYNLSLEEFIVLLAGFYNLNHEQVTQGLVEKGFVEKNLFNAFPPMLSDNTKNLVARILTESDDKVLKSGIDFEDLAEKLRACYPDGFKPGTTYPWRATNAEIAQKLRALISAHNFYFTEKEAIAAVKEYVDSFKNFKYMRLLKSLLLKTYENPRGDRESESLFMTIIENNRKNEADN